MNFNPDMALEVVEISWRGLKKFLKATDGELLNWKIY